MYANGEFPMKILEKLNILIFWNAIALLIEDN